MSILTIKSALETHLKTNITDVAIKWNNTSHYTKNNIALTQIEIDALEFFIEPKIIPISDSREMMSTDNPFSTEVFFQIDIYNKVNSGSGDVFNTIESLNTLFRESYVSSVLCDYVDTINTFEADEWVITPHRIHAKLWS